MQNTSPSVQMTAVSNAPSRKMFRSYFKNRWQSYQNIVNDGCLNQFIPPNYLPYYNAFIRQWLEWSRGFVPMLHSQDFFSTGMGYTVCDIMTRECLTGGYRFTATDPKTKAFVNEWCKEDLNNILNKAFFFSNAGGNALLALYPANGEIYPAVYPIDRCFFQIARDGKVISAMFLNRFASGEDSAYYAKEMRMQLPDGTCCWEIELFNAGLVNSPTWNDGAPIKKVPKEIAMAWYHTYGDLKPSTVYTFPEALNGIGVYNIKNKSVAVALADMPGYADSTLHTALDVLYSIDYNYTQAQVDQYLGRGRALVPKQMTPMRARDATGAPIVLEGQSYADAVTQIKDVPLDETFYMQIGESTIDGKPIAPTFMQPDLRGEVRRHIRDAELELLASKVGLSASTLAAHLAGSGTKTDDEVNAESSTTEKTVFNKRTLAATAINAMMTDVARFYGYTDKVSIQWGRTTSNSMRENRELMEDYMQGTISLIDYIKRRYPDMEEEEAIAFAERARKDYQERQNVSLPPMMDDHMQFADGEPIEDEYDPEAEAALLEGGLQAE